MVRSEWNHVSFLQVQRTIKRAEISALYMVLMKLCGPAEVFCDHRGVVQALNKGQVNCTRASQGRESVTRTREPLGSRWRKIGECIDEGIDLCEVQARGLG